MSGVILFMAAAGISLLGAMPFSLEIRCGKVLRVHIRYLCFRYNLNSILIEQMRRPFVMADFLKTLKVCASFAQCPLHAKRFRLKMTFSSEDAAETALLHGSLRMIFSSLYPRLSVCKPEILLIPCFSPHDRLSVDCDIAVALPAAALIVKVLPVLAASIRASRER
jgi:hypothetical protein